VSHEAASCPFCEAAMAPGPPWAPGDGHRLAYDPEKGRLWNVCSGCARWVLTPMESRWETLEACEAAVAREGKVKYSTSHLSLVRLEAGELVRVGAPPRTEFVDWRYGPRLGEGTRATSFWARLLSRLPSPPVGGYDPYRGFEGAMRAGPWIASPFLEHATPLTYLFSQIPLVPVCPSCRGPLALRPWDFQDIEFHSFRGLPGLRTFCALCRTGVRLDLREARPALRVGISLVASGTEMRRSAFQAAEALNTVGGPMGFLDTLAGTRISLGELDALGMGSLIISLDELAEMEALEAEWRKAEEMAAIMDGELTDLPGFEEFRQEILDQGE
jgi:hypothetical protein